MTLWIAIIEMSWLLYGSGLKSSHLYSWVPRWFLPRCTVHAGLAVRRGYTPHLVKPYVLCTVVVKPYLSVARRDVWATPARRGASRPKHGVELRSPTSDHYRHGVYKTRGRLHRLSVM